jgi:hypothetical protein
VPGQGGLEYKETMMNAPCLLLSIAMCATKKSETSKRNSLIRSWALDETTREKRSRERYTTRHYTTKARAEILHH